MPVERPTFSESWYRVASLRPHLRATVQTYRQHYRGRMYHVVQDPSSNQFFRLNGSSYRFMAMLDGRRTVEEVWRACNDQLGDDAPTQGEAIQLLGQLYTSNLLHAELPPDAQGLFRRHQKRVRRELKGYLFNLLFVRIPLLDPDRLLNGLVGIGGAIFTKLGCVLWLALLAAGVWAVMGRWDELTSEAGAVLAPQHLPLLYACFILVKVFHEFGHALATKKFGRQAGTGGEVHAMGVMLLVFLPLPYVDASSAWALRNKWHRVVIGAAGMMVEMGIAAIAAMVWAATADGVVHSIAYNVMLVGSVSTLVFNGNPLLRYDAYYMLSDLIEIPNLAQRSKDFLQYLVKRYAWGVKLARNPANSRGEAAWFVFYGVASTIYRVFVSVAILLFISQQMFFVGVLLAMSAAVAWLVVPLLKFVHYLLTSSELIRVRQRAMLTTAAVASAIVVGVGFYHASEHYYVEGVVEPRRLAIIYARGDGEIADSLASGTLVGPDSGKPLLTARNISYDSELQQLLADGRRLQTLQSAARDKGDTAMVQIVGRQMAALDEQRRRCEEKIAELTILPPLAGTWVAPDIEQFRGAEIRKGRKLGLVASLDDLVIRATAGQEVAGALIDELSRWPDVQRVEIRVDGRPDLFGEGTVLKVLPAGQEELPSAALGYGAGGDVPTSPAPRRSADPAQEKRTAEAQAAPAATPLQHVFEIRVAPGKGVPLLPGQRVVVRLELKSKPLMVQWVRRLGQLVQRRGQA